MLTAEDPILEQWQREGEYRQATQTTWSVSLTFQDNIFQLVNWEKKLEVFYFKIIDKSIKKQFPDYFYILFNI